MAQYPNSLFTPRTVANRAGVSYDAAKTKVFYAEDLNTPNGEIVAIQETLGLNPEGTYTSVVDRLDDVDAQLSALDETGGWRALATTPIRQSTDDPVFVLRFGADMTAILGRGMRIQLTQNGTVRYFIVVGMGAYTGGNTDVTVYGGTDYDVNDSTTYPISSPKYSREKAPLGFPLDVLKWSIKVTNNATQQQASPVNGTWYNPGSISISIPIGLWRVSYKAMLNVATTTGQTVCGFSKMTLSTANNSETDSDLTIASYFSGASAQLWFYVPCYTSKDLLLSAKTSYYLDVVYLNSNGSTIGIKGDSEVTVITAVCLYL